MIVLDSSFLVAFHNRRDVHHGRARAAMEHLADGKWGPALLPEYVLLEVATVLLARRNLKTAVSVTRSLLQARQVEFVPCSDHFLETLEVFANQHRTKLSFADAAIVAIAKRRSARYVATFDADFRGVAGLTTVP